MHYPKNIRSIREKIYHILHVRVVVPREEIYIEKAKPLTVTSKISQMLSEEVITVNKLGHITLTLQGNNIYAKLITAEIFPEVTLDAVMNLFSKHAKPKGIKAIVDKFYAGFNETKSRHRAQYLVTRLVNEERIIMYSKDFNTKTYVRFDNPLASKLSPKRASPIELRELEIAKNLKKNLAIFYKALPGTLTAHPSKKKEYCY